MTILLLAEIVNGALNEATAKALTAAKALGEPVHILVAGEGVEVAARGRRDTRRRRESAGRRRSALCASAGRTPRRASRRTWRAAYSAILAAATSSGKNVMPRIAALLDVMQISEIIKVLARRTFSSVRSTPATRSRPCNRATPRWSSPCARRRFPAGRGGAAPIETIAVAGGAGGFALQGRSARQIGAPRTRRGQDHHLRRPRHAERGQFQDANRAHRRQARRGNGRVARRRRCRLRAQ